MRAVVILESIDHAVGFVTDGNQNNVGCERHRIGYEQRQIGGAWAIDALECKCLRPRAVQGRRVLAKRKVNAIPHSNRRIGATRFLVDHDHARAAIVRVAAGAEVQTFDDQAVRARADQRQSGNVRPVSHSGIVKARAGSADQVAGNRMSIDKDGVVASAASRPVKDHLTYSGAGRYLYIKSAALRDQPGAGGDKAGTAFYREGTQSFGVAANCGFWVGVGFRLRPRFGFRLRLEHNCGFAIGEEDRRFTVRVAAGQVGSGNKYDARAVSANGRLEMRISAGYVGNLGECFDVYVVEIDLAAAVRVFPGKIIIGLKDDPAAVSVDSVPYE